MMFNPTIVKYVDEKTIIHQFDNWILSYRKRQVTHYSLMLFANSDAKTFLDLESKCQTDLGVTLSQIEASLETISQPQRINIQSVMMVDPHVHFHIIPRYDDKNRDPFWPDVADIKYDMKLPIIKQKQQVNELRSYFSDES